jgi:hypothetical protein
MESMSLCGIDEGFDRIMLNLALACGTYALIIGAGGCYFLYLPDKARYAPRRSGRRC